MVVMGMSGVIVSRRVMVWVWCMVLVIVGRVVVVVVVVRVVYSSVGVLRVIWMRLEFCSCWGS